MLKPFALEIVTIRLLGTLSMYANTECEWPRREINMQVFQDISGSDNISLDTPTHPHTYPHYPAWSGFC